MSSSPDLTQEVRLLPLLESALLLEGGAHPTRGSEHVECGTGVLKASRASQIQLLDLGLMGLVVLSPRLVQPPTLPCPELSSLINLSSFHSILLAYINYIEQCFILA